MKNSNKNQHTFSVKYTTLDGEELEGQFTCKRLTIMDRARLGVRRSQLTGGFYTVRDDMGNPTGQGIDDATDFLNSMIAHLEQVLVSKPLWWDLEELSDLGIIREVYKNVVEFEDSFFRSSDREAEQPVNDGNGSATSDSQSSEQGSGNVPKKVVGQEVQAALDA